MCEIFSEKGHKVYGFDRRESTIEHPDYKHYCLDIRDKEMYPELPPMQIVINNAGVQNEDDIDINLKGTIAVTEHYAVQPEIRSVIMIDLQAAIPDLNSRNMRQVKVGSFHIPKMLR